MSICKPLSPVNFECCKSTTPGVCMCILRDSSFHISCTKWEDFRSFGGVLGVCSYEEDNLITFREIVQYFER